MRSKTDEQSLIEQASKNPQAFAKLYDRYIEQIYRYALRRTGNRGLAEDVTSATFEKALRHLNTHGWKGNSYKAWLYMIANQQVIEHHRRNQRYVALTDETESEIDIEETTENTLQWADIVQAMGEALAERSGNYYFAADRPFIQFRNRTILAMFSPKCVCTTLPGFQTTAQDTGYNFRIRRRK